MTRVLRYGAQALFYAAFAAFIGYFSNAPRYEHLPPDQALLKLSLTHAGQRKEACRERSAEELAKLAPNMRAQTVCPRERAPVIVEVVLDQRPLLRVEAAPSGLAKDGASTFYRRVPIAAGTHRISARLADGPDGVFHVTGETVVTLAPGRIVVIDFEPQVGFVFRS